MYGVMFANLLLIAGAQRSVHAEPNVLWTSPTHSKIKMLYKYCVCKYIHIFSYT